MFCGVCLHIRLAFDVFYPCVAAGAGTAIAGKFNGREAQGDPNMSFAIHGRSSGTNSRYAALATIYLRLALGIGFLSAVADRFGLWGPAGTPMVAWGNFHNFLVYAGKLNPWFPASWIPTVGWMATVCELVFGLALIVGYRTRLAAGLSGLLTLAFALGMVVGLGIHAPLDYSVFVVSAGSFLLGEAKCYPWSVDGWRIPVVAVTDGAKPDPALSRPVAARAAREVPGHRKTSGPWQSGQFES